MIKRLDFIEWARNNGHGKKQVPMDMLEIILDYQKYAESEVENLDIQRVSKCSTFNQRLCITANCLLSFADRERRK